MKLSYLPVVVLCLLCLAPLSIADDKEDETDKPKPKVMASAMNLIGKWKVDAKAFKESLTGTEEIPKELAETFFKEIKMDFVFEPDGKLKMNVSFAGQDMNETGTWKVNKLEGSTAIIHMGPDNDKKMDIKIEFIDKDTLDLYLPEEEAKNSPFKKLRFNRVKE